MNDTLDAVNTYFSASSLLDQLTSYINALANVTIATFGFMIVARCLRALARGDGRI